MDAKIFCILIIASLALHGCTLKRQLQEPSTQKNLEFSEPLNQATVLASKILMNRLPTSLERSNGAANIEKYKLAIKNFMASEDFKMAMVREHQDYFGLGGQTAGADIDFDDPARLGAYIVANDQDYRNILKGAKCIGPDFKEKPFCDTFSDQATADANGAGVLTTRAFVSTHKRPKAFNFRIVNEAFQKFTCSTYPDLTDKKMPAPQISSKIHPWGLTPSGTTSDCYGCHGSMNPKAFLFYSYDFTGKYSTNSSITTRTDANTMSVKEDVINPGFTPNTHERNLASVKDLGEVMAQDPRFAPCMTQRYLNFILGRDYASSVMGLEKYSQAFIDSGYNVKILITTILTGDLFIKRVQGVSAN